MDLKINDKIHGFTVTRIRDVEEFEGRLVEMTHDRTGAGLVWADCAEENKLFSVGFRTLPEDSTGVFHILEHSVLCGSDKYPVREPFVELLKTSMNTFLNAMTYSDKTLYPVSSRMEQDYLNLMEVYLDAVFRPRILADPNIFRQEGWHIDLSGDKPAYKGVVFNEMKGAMSDVDQLAERTLLKILFPDTCYGFNSGGDPDAIPDLTYEDFVARYRRFYHPSNSYFYLDGAIPLEKTLVMIDSYLSQYDRLDDVPELMMQTPAKSDSVIGYEVSDESGKAVVAAGRIAGTWKDRDRILALGVLIEQLADSNESPVKRAVLSSGLAGDLEIYVSDGVAQPYIMMLFREVDPSALGEAAVKGLSTEEAVRLAAERLLSIVSDTARAMLGAGIPHRDLEASVNQLDFRLRQYPEPQGLYRANAVLNSWLYGGDPALYLKSNEAIAELRRLIADGEAERLAEEFLVDISGYSTLLMIPSSTLGEENAAAEARRVEGIVSAMTAEELEALRAENASLLNWQETPDSEEALATIPQLDIADISRVPELIDTSVSKSDGVTLITHKLHTKGIVYINAMFPLTDLSLDELPAAALITEFYKDLPTENYSVTDLQNEIRMHVGSISFGIDVSARDDDRTGCTPYLRARAAVLSENLSHAEDLIIEIMTRTKFDDRTLMKELIDQIDEEGKRFAVSSGHRVALYAARSHYSARDAAAEALNGFTFIQYLHGFRAEFDERIEDFARFAREVIDRAVVRKGAVFSVTASDGADISRLIGMLPEGSARPVTAAYTSPLPSRLGIRVPASVSHAVEAYDLAMMGTKSAGSLAVAANILSLAYLWNEIRVKGGAYGTSVSGTRTGSMFCYSYRDPSPVKSLETFRGMSPFLEAFASAEEAPLDGFIISAVANTEPLISPAAKGRAADDFWLSGFADADRIRIREQLLDTTAEDLSSWCSAFAALADKGSVCVIGPAAALDTCPDLETVSI